MTFDDFVPGQSLGLDRRTVGIETVNEWRQLFPKDPVEAGSVPAGCAMVLIMQAYSRLLFPRPPGNIHKSQRLRISNLPQIGEEVSTELVCAAKEQRRGRFYIQMNSRTTGGDRRELFTGEMTIIWAA